MQITNPSYKNGGILVDADDQEEETARGEIRSCLKTPSNCCVDKQTQQYKDQQQSIAPPITEAPNTTPKLLQTLIGQKKRLYNFKLSLQRKPRRSFAGKGSMRSKKSSNRAKNHGNVGKQLSDSVAKSQKLKNLMAWKAFQEYGTDKGTSLSKYATLVTAFLILGERNPSNLALLQEFFVEYIQQREKHDDFKCLMEVIRHVQKFWRALNVDLRKDASSSVVTQLVLGKFYTMQQYKQYARETLDKFVEWLENWNDSLSRMSSFLHDQEKKIDEIPIPENRKSCQRTQSESDDDGL